MSVKKSYVLEKQNLEECLKKEPPVSILRSDSEPIEYEPTWGNMQKMVIYVSPEENDFEIRVDEYDIPYELKKDDEDKEDNEGAGEKEKTSKPKEESCEQLDEQCFKRMKNALANDEDMSDIENFLIPEVKMYYTFATETVNSKYGICAGSPFPAEEISVRTEKTRSIESTESSEGSSEEDSIPNEEEDYCSNDAD